MRVCEHGYVKDLHVLLRLNFVLKAIEQFFRVYIASSKHAGDVTTSQACITASNSPKPREREKVLYCLIINIHIFFTIYYYLIIN